MYVGAGVSICVPRNSCPLRRALCEEEEEEEAERK